jgi:2-oxoacid:acceptor oxidoreductase alpha subunit
MLQQVDRVAQGDEGLQRVNDFVVKFANVNGSGSASANSLFAKAVLRMGVASTPRNIFPSNIQGLPTWYEVRVSEAGHLGARGGGVDLMVAMNPQTWDEDVHSIVPGGYLFYDNTKPMPASKFREDIVVLGVPLTEMTNAAYSDPRQRQLFKNIVGLGSLATLLDMDVPSIEGLLAEQFKGRDKLIAANIQALHMGIDWVSANMEHPIGLRMRKASTVGDRIFIEGNAAAALGAVYGGATVCAWYPITPSSSLAEAFMRYTSRMRRDKATGKAKVAIMQAEDELASIGMVIGAAWNGARAFTTTSGPGISLMQEFIGLAYFAEIPAVIFDVQRAGPSTGMPTKTEQADLLMALYGRNGESPVAIVAPATPSDCFDIALEAVRIATKYRTPVIILSDGYLANGSEPWRIPEVAGLPKLRDEFSFSSPNEWRGDDGKVEFLPFRRDPRTLARPWAVPGTPDLEHRIGGIEKADVAGTISYDPDNHDRMVRLRQAKIDGIAADIGPLEVDDPDGEAKVLVLGWGSTFGSIGAAVRRVRLAGGKVAQAHLRHLSPFPANLPEVLTAYDKVLVPEINLGQLALVLRGRYLVDVISYNRVRGLPFRAAELAGVIEDVIANV